MAILLALFVWVVTVMAIRRQRRPDIYLVDFKTYRHTPLSGDPRCSAGKPVSYERFMAESVAARHTDGSNCFNERSLDFQEKILRTSWQVSFFSCFFSREGSENVMASSFCFVFFFLPDFQEKILRTSWQVPFFSCFLSREGSENVLASSFFFVTAPRFGV